MSAGTPLAGARVLVTGGASGIGRKLALDAATRGAQVIIWDLDADGAGAVCAEIKRIGGRATWAAVDITDADQVHSAAAEAGELDVLINNAGIVTGTRLLEGTEAGIRRTFAVNTLSLYWVTRAFLGGMIGRRRGTVVTVASAAGLLGVARQTDYSASKWAAVGFDESLRAELRTDGHAVRTLVVCPYYVDTGMFDGATSRFQALMPTLRTADVARATLDAIESGQRRLFLPAAGRLIPMLRVLPTRAFDFLVDVLGISTSMSGFTGRSRRPEP